LLIIGGHKQSFSAVSRAYSAAEKVGAGAIRVLLPLSLQKLLGRTLPEAEFADSTAIGSFSRQALGLFLELSDWADGVLLAGEFGRNSETAVLLENYATKFAGRLTLTGDSLDYFLTDPSVITGRPKTTITVPLGQLQKLAKSAALRQADDLVQILNKLSIWTAKIQASVVTGHSGQIIVADNGKLSTTPVKDREINEELAAYASVWTMQQSTKPFEALTIAVYCQ
ncbi:MAG TPA: hypothetical protein VFK97_02805, partial [Candidatus Saccharimonadales bacterium]|nr:hypothetical protein [Candidatus Saccharimonadales bacterium]